MKLLNILFLLSTILIISSANLLVFDTNQAQNCVILMSPCFFDDPDIWGNTTVHQGDSFLIDLTSLTNFTSQTLYFKTRNALRSGNFSDITAIGTQLVQPKIMFANTTALVFNNVNVTNGFLVFDNDGVSQAGNNVEILSSWTVKNTSIVGTDTNLVSEGILLDADSSMLFQSKSSVQIDGMATFYGSVNFLDSSFAVTDVIDGYLTFNKGINSDDTVIIGKATIYGNSNFETLIVNGEINFSNATAIIGDTLKFVQTSESQGQFILDQGSSITVAGTADINILNVVINDYSNLIISNFNADITNCTGNGGTISYSIDIFNENNFSNNNITNLNSPAVDIKITGKVDLWITNSNGGKIIEIPPADNSTNPPKLVYFDGSSTFNSIITTNTNVTVNGMASLTLNGSGSGTISQLDVWGTAVVNGESTFGTLIANGQVIFENNATTTFTNSVVVNGQIVFNKATGNINNQYISTFNAPNLVLNQASSLYVAGAAEIVVSNIVLNDLSGLVINNLNADISNVTGDGGILAFTIDGPEFSNNNITGIQSDSIDIHYYGKALLFISNSNGGQIVEVPSANENPTKLVTFEQGNSFSVISTVNTQIAVSDNSALVLSGHGSMINGGDLSVLGNLYINQNTLNIDPDYSIVVIDSMGELVLNGSTVNGNVKVVAGQIATYGSSEITQNLYITENGIIAFNSESGSLTVNQTVELFGAFYMDSYVVPNSAPQLTVNGNLYFNQNSSVYIDFLNIPNRGQVYNLIKYFGTVSGTINNINLWIEGQLFNTIKATVQNVQANEISLVLEAGTKVHKGLPGWGAFLIIVAVVGVVAGCFYGFYRYKKREGYLPLN